MSCTESEQSKLNCRKASRTNRQARAIMSHTNASDGESGPSGHPRWKEAFGSAFSSRGAVSKPLPGDEYAILQNAETFRVLFNTMTEGFALHEIICDDNGKPTCLRFGSRAFA